MIRKSVLLVPLFTLFILYVMQATWSVYDIQYFTLIFPNQEYPGALIAGRLWQAIFVAGLVILGSTVLVSLRLLPTAMVILVAMAVASVAWSMDWSTTLTSTALLLVMLAYSAVSVHVFGIERCLSLVWWIGAAALLVGTAMAAIGEPHAMMGGQHSGSWRGFFPHKNVYGSFAATMFVLTTFGAQYVRIPRLLRLLVAAVAILAIIASRSSSAIVVLGLSTAFGLAAYCRARNINTQITIYVVVALAAVPIMTIATANLDAAADLLGRDLTLTGRTGLWAAAFPFTIAAPFGYGFGTSGGERVIEVMRLATGWVEASSTHNSFVRMALDIGWAGALIMAGFLLGLMVSIRYSLSRQTAALLASVAAIQFFTGMTEVIAGVYPSFNFFLLLIVVMAEVPRRAGVAMPVARQT